MGRPFNPKDLAEKAFSASLARLPAKTIPVFMGFHNSRPSVR